MLGQICAAIFKMVVNHAVLTLSKTWSDMVMHIPIQFNVKHEIKLFFNVLKKYKADPRGLFKTNTGKRSNQNMIWLV